MITQNTPKLAACAVALALAIPASAAPLTPGAVPSPIASKIGAQLDRDGVVYTVIDIEKDPERILELAGSAYGILAEASGELPPFTPELFSEIGAMTGLTGVDGIGFSSIGLKEGGFVNRVFVYTPAGREGILRITGGEPHAFESLAMAPASTVYLVESDLDVSAVLEMAKKLATRIGGEMALTQMNEVLGKPVAPMPGIPTIGEAVEGMDAHYMAFLSVGEGQIEVPGRNGETVTFPQIEGLVALDGAPWLMNLAMAAAGDKVTVTETAAGVSITPKEAPPAPFGEFYQPVLFQDSKSGRLYLATSADYLSECLKGEGGLRNDQDFKEATRHLPTEGNAFYYISPEVGKFVAKNVKVVQGLFGVDESFRSEGMAQLTDAWLSVSGMGGAVAAATVNRPDGIYSVSRADISLKTSFAAIAVAPTMVFAGAGLASYRSVSAPMEVDGSQAYPAAREEDVSEGAAEAEH